MQLLRVYAPYVKIQISQLILPSRATLPTSIWAQETTQDPWLTIYFGDRMREVVKSEAVYGDNELLGEKNFHAGCKHTLPHFLRHTAVVPAPMLEKEKGAAVTQAAVDGVQHDETDATSTCVRQYPIF